jgi:hypothetical protein
MVRAFAELTWWSVRNRARVAVRRLREPRYALGALFVLLWVGSIFLRSFFEPARHGRPWPTAFDDIRAHPELAQFIGTISLLIVALLMEWMPDRRRALEFTPAEVQFLFAAPITRRQVIHYKLLRGQGGMLFGALVATVLMRPHALRDGWMFSAGFWLGLSALRLYQIGVVLAGSEPRRRRALYAAGFVVIGVLAAAAAPVWNELGVGNVWERLEVLRRAWSGVGPRIVLWPCAALARLPLADSPGAFAAALPGVLLLNVAAYAWVLRMDAALDEAASVRAANRAATPTLAPRVYRRDLAEPFPLALAGRPETAILWKNLILLGRYMSLGLTVRILPFFLIFAPLFVVGGKSSARSIAVLIAALNVAGMIIFIGPGIMWNDLRHDLRRLALLKSWPVSGVALVRGQLLAPTLVLTVASWLPVVGAALAVGGLPERGRLLPLLLPHRGTYALALMLAAAAVVLAQIVVQNALAVLLPAWLVMGRRSVGLENMGQSMLIVIGGWTSAIAFVAPGALAGYVLQRALSSTGAGAFVVAAAVLLAFVVGETLLMTTWLGRVLERSDLQSLDPVE